MKRGSSSTPWRSQYLPLGPPLGAFRSFATPGGLRADGVPGWRRAVLLFRASARGGLRVHDANRRPTTSSAPATAAWASRVFPPFPAEAASGPSGSGPRRRLAAAFECTMLVGARRRPARPPRRRGSPSSGGHRYPPLTAGQLVVCWAALPIPYQHSFEYMRADLVHIFPRLVSSARRTKFGSKTSARTPASVRIQRR